jgi:hypothetical protein
MIKIGHAVAAAVLGVGLVNAAQAHVFVGVNVGMPVVPVAPVVMAPPVAMVAPVVPYAPVAPVAVYAPPVPYYAAPVPVYAPSVAVGYWGHPGWSSRHYAVGYWR